jgi:hypothetical protein
MAHVNLSTGQYQHARAREPLPDASKAMWLSPARRRGRGLFAFSQEPERRPPCAEEYFPFEFVDHAYYAETVRTNLHRMGYLTKVDAEPAEVSSALAVWYFSKPNRTFGVACVGGGGSLIANPTMLEAIRTEAGPSAATEDRAADEAGVVTPRMQTDMMRWGLLGAGVLAVGGIGYLIWRRSR